MKLHVDWKIITADMHDLLTACAQGITGTDRHLTLSKRLRDPNEENRTSAKFSVVANCITCGESIVCAIQTIWHRGSPISLQLHDGVCPSCGGKDGFEYQELKGLHA